jgi:chromosomal replication initiation ATPase DnaA
MGGGVTASKFSTSNKVKPPAKLVRQTLETVAFWHGIEPEQILSTRRDAATVAARADAIRNLHAFGRGRFSTTGIGQAIGLDHSTVLYWLSEGRRARQLERVTNHYRERRAWKSPPISPSPPSSSASSVGSCG